ncbi:MAG: HDOD domain-containing protein [Planctomycetaceae bacterium]|jgi:HD-like signal output (HDOD) protein|nr:HDOD domain-containing protein [Planctomycetaceae bacterium]
MPSITENPHIQETHGKEELQNMFRVEQLPAMPHSALIVLQLDSDLSKVNINDLVRPIEADLGLTTQVLKFLNSAFFGFQNSISSIKQGIALAGIRTVKNFVLWKAVFSLIPKTIDSFFDVKFLWQDSLRRALFARKLLALLGRGDEDLTFAGALLQDMAIPLLLKKRPQPTSGLIQELNRRPNCRLSELEQEIFGWTHADAAEIMCQSWKIPEDLSALIANHTRIEPYMDEPTHNPEQLSVSLSALLPSVVNTHWFEEEKLRHYFNVLFPTKPNILENLFEQVDKEFDQYAVILQISRPKIAIRDQISK